MAEGIYVTCPPGLESCLRQELAEYGIQPEVQKIEQIEGGEDSGGVEFTGGLSAIQKINLLSRVAGRILLRLGSFHAVSFAELRRKASRLNWGFYLLPGTPVALRVTCKKSRLYHSDGVAERVAGAIQDCLGRESLIVPYEETPSGVPPQLVIVRFFLDQCTISLDSSGNHLHRRGYRQAASKAPLRENLAAGLLLITGWDARTPFIDPFCGSGTLPIEAAMIAANIPPGIHRSFAFQKWKGFDSQAWEKTVSTAREQILSSQLPSILGADRDAGAINMSEQNARRAGVESHITFKEQAISLLEPMDRHGWIVTNPPYGMRISNGKDLRNLYSRFGEILRTRFSGWCLGILCSDDTLVRQLGMQFSKKLSLVNGGIPVHFYCIDIK